MPIKKLTSDLKSTRWIYFKAFLFLLIGLIALGLIAFESRSFRMVLLTLVAIWAFCRLYYFAFYVIEKYVDPEFRFASLTAFFVYLISGKNQKADDDKPDR